MMLKSSIAAFARRSRSILGTACLTVVASAAVVGGARAEDLENPWRGKQEGIAAGEARFAERCAFCHGGRGKGGKGPSLTTGHFKRGGKSTGALFGTIATGVPQTGMGAFGTTLAPDEIFQIIAFLHNEYKIRVKRGDIDAVEDYPPGDDGAAPVVTTAPR